MKIILGLRKPEREGVTDWAWDGKTDAIAKSQANKIRNIVNKLWRTSTEASNQFSFACFWSGSRQLEPVMSPEQESKQGTDETKRPPGGSQSRPPRGSNRGRRGRGHRRRPPPSRPRAQEPEGAQQEQPLEPAIPTADVALTGEIAPLPSEQPPVPSAPPPPPPAHPAQPL